MTLSHQLPRLAALLQMVGFSATEVENALQSHRYGDGYGSEALNVAGGSAAAIGHAFARRRLYRVACATVAFRVADDRWSTELARVYGRSAGDARYDRRRNRATPGLDRLATVRDRVQLAYDRAWSSHHASARQMGA